jgi:hypothetical protein
MKLQFIVYKRGILWPTVGSWNFILSSETKKPIGIDFSATHDTKSVPDNLTTEAVLTAQIRDATRFLKEVGIVKE